MQRLGDTTTAVGLRNSIEAFGLPQTGSMGKSYLLGQLPIADAFIAWGNSVEPTRNLTGTALWRTFFQLRSAGFAALLLGLIWGLQPKLVAC